MSDTGLSRFVRTAISRLWAGWIQDCPPELYACEVCGELRCHSAQWTACEKRLAACEFMKTGNREALAQLRALSETAPPRCAELRSRADPPDPTPGQTPDFTAPA